MHPLLRSGCSSRFNITIFSEMLQGALNGWRLELVVLPLVTGAGEGVQVGVGVQFSPLVLLLEVLHIAVWFLTALNG